MNDDLPSDIDAFRRVLFWRLDASSPFTDEDAEKLIEKMGQWQWQSHSEAIALQKGLGDYVAAGLSAVGITKERVSAALGRPCGCEARQEWMNRVGAEYLGIGTAQNSH